MTHKGFVKYANEIQDPIQRIERIKNWQKMRFTASIGWSGERLKKAIEHDKEYESMIEMAKSQI